MAILRGFGKEESL